MSEVYAIITAKNVNCSAKIKLVQLQFAESLNKEVFRVY